MQDSIKTHGNFCTELGRPVVGIVTPLESVRPAGIGGSLRANGSVTKCACLQHTWQFYGRLRGKLGAHFGQVSQLYMHSSGM